MKTDREWYIEFIAENCEGAFTGKTGGDERTVMVRQMFEDLRQLSAVDCCVAAATAISVMQSLADNLHGEHLAQRGL